MEVKFPIKTLLKDIEHLVSPESIIGKPVNDIHGNKIGEVTRVEDDHFYASVEGDDEVVMGFINSTPSFDFVRVEK